jgi:hypothetical protein
MRDFFFKGLEFTLALCSCAVHFITWIAFLGVDTCEGSYCVCTLMTTRTRASTCAFVDIFCLKIVKRKVLITKLSENYISIQNI